MFNTTYPEKVGICSGHIADYISFLKRRGIIMHSIIMLRGNDIFAEYYYAPFNKDFRHRMYSETKSYVSIAIGLLEEEGKLNLDDKIADWFPENVDETTCDYLKEQTIKNMLMMETGVNCDYWFTSENPDRVDLYFKGKQKPYPAGTVWEYDSPGSQVLCALVEKITGKYMLDYLKEKLFNKMGTFQNAEILKTRNGVSWGDSALVCTPRDMLSFGRFVMNYGTWNGERLMNEKYLREATSQLAYNSPAGFYHSDSCGYGYQIWKMENDSFAFVGMGGQLTICVPDKDFIFVCTGDNQGNPHAYDRIVNGLFDFVVNKIEDSSVEVCEKEVLRLKEETSDLKLWHIDGKEKTCLTDKINGKTFKCDNNRCGITEFSLNFNEDGTGEFNYINEQGAKTIPFGINKNVFAKFPQLGYSNEYGSARTTDGFMYDCAASGAWIEEEKFMLRVQIIDKYFGQLTVTFSFKGDIVSVLMQKTAEDFLNEYHGYILGHKE